MTINRSSFQLMILAGMLLVLAPMTVDVLAAAQTEGGCPPIIASLFPKSATNRTGQYFPADLGQGSGSADVSFEDPICSKQRFSARIKVEVKHYGGETAILIKSKDSPYGTIDRDADKALAVKNAQGILAQTRLTPKTEKLGIGEIVYVERLTECPPASAR